MASTLDTRIAPHVGKRLRLPLADSINTTLAEARLRLGDALAALGAIDTQVEECTSTTPARPTGHHQADRERRPCPVRRRGRRRVRVRQRTHTTTRAGSARRRPHPRRGRLVEADGRADERHDPRPRCPIVWAWATSPCRCREPVRLCPPRVALLRDAPAGSSFGPLSRRRARRAGGADLRRWRTHACAVHELEGDGPRRRGLRRPARRRRS